MLKKVGVSPLIAGVFLIIIASALGFLLASQLNVSEQNEVIKLRKEGICGESILIELSNDVCISDTGVIFNINNKGNKIDNVQIRTITDDWVLEKELNSFIDAKQNKELIYNYDFEKYGNIKQIKIRPIIENEAEIVICLDKSITTPAEDIISC